MLKYKTDFKSLLKLILEDLITILPNAQTGSVLIVKDKKLNYAATVGYNLEKLQKIQFQVKEKEYVSHDMNINLDKDINSWNRNYLTQEELKTLKEYGGLNSIKVIITFPLIGREGNIIGSVNVENHCSKDAFNKNDVKIAQEFKKTAENIIQAKIMVDKQITNILTLKNILIQIYSIYDNYSHNIRNNLQVILLLIGLKNNKFTDIEKNTIKDKINELEEISASIINRKGQNIVEKDLIRVFEDKANKIIVSLKEHIFPKYFLKLVLLKNSAILSEIFCENYINFKSSNKLFIDASHTFPMHFNYSLKIKLLFKINDFTEFTKLEQMIYPRHIQTIINLEFQRFFLKTFKKSLIDKQIRHKKLIEFFKFNLNQFLEYITNLEDRIEIKKENWTKSIIEIKNMVIYILKMNEHEYENLNQLKDISDENK